MDAGDSVELDGSGSTDSDGTIVNYVWRDGTDVLANGETATLEDMSVGVYQIDLTVTDNEGATDIDRVRIEVEAVVVPNEAPVADAGPDQMFEAGNALVLDGSASTDDDGIIVSYEWFDGDGTAPLATGVTASVPDLAADTYFINLVVTDDDGDIDTDQLEVMIIAAVLDNELPVADAGEDQSILEGDDLLLDGSGSSDGDGTIVSYEWSDERSTFGNGETVILGGLEAGSYTIELLVTDNDGGTDTDQLEVTVDTVDL